jgi:peptidoglycan/LPS O-acetylase OafA/YrhL
MAAQAQRWPFLDLVRLGAALLVLFGHTRGLYLVSIRDVPEAGLATRAFYLVTGVHHEAVMLFFVVSGFLIGGAVWEDMERGRFDLRRYLVNRFARIYLVLIPALALTLAITAAGREFLADTRLFGLRPLPPANITATWTLDQIPCHLAALPGVACAPWGANPPLWSLGYEWTFYLMAPLLFGIWYAPERMLWRGLALLAFAATAASLLAGAEAWPFLFGTWLLGAVSARVVARTSLPLWLGLVGLAVACAAMVVSRTGALPLRLSDLGVAGGLALALCCREIVTFSVAERIVSRGAGFSFSLYLIHLPVGLLIGAILERLGWPAMLVQPGLAALAAFGITLAGCLFSAHLFARATEDHTAALRRLLRGRAREGTVQAAEQSLTTPS